jgi:hypothetical protein
VNGIWAIEGEIRAAIAVVISEDRESGINCPGKSINLILAETDKPSILAWTKDRCLGIPITIKIGSKRNVLRQTKIKLLDFVSTGTPHEIDLPFALPCARDSAHGRIDLSVPIKIRRHWQVASLPERKLSSEAFFMLKTLCNVEASAREQNVPIPIFRIPGRDIGRSVAVIVSWNGYHA